MSEQENKIVIGEEAPVVSATVLVDQTAEQCKEPCRPTDLEPDPDCHSNQSCAPAVPMIADEIHKEPEANASDVKQDTEQIENITPAPEQINCMASKTMSATKREPSSSEGILIVEVNNMVPKTSISTPTQPIPPPLESITTVPKKSAPELAQPEQPEVTKPDDTGTNLEVEKQASRDSDWSGEEEASGLPRGSRVSRAVRQLFCCGVPYEAPSEDNVFSPRSYAT